MAKMKSTFRTGDEIWIFWSPAPRHTTTAVLGLSLLSSVNLQHLKLKGRQFTLKSLLGSTDSFI